MITTNHHCRDCQSVNIVKNGHNRSGSSQYVCKDCGSRKVPEPHKGYSEERKEEVLRAYQERSGLRGVARIFGISRQTITNWLKKKLLNLPSVAGTLIPALTDDVLEPDEVWSFVCTRVNQVWLWTALCRRTRQIVAFVNGDHSLETCRKLWDQIPEQYRLCHTFSDFWKAYESVFPEETHRSAGKETGETAHMERWNNTLRQRVGRFVRKTLSFSKNEWWHDKVISWFIITYNLSITSC